MKGCNNYFTLKSGSAAPKREGCNNYGSYGTSKSKSNIKLLSVIYLGKTKTFQNLIITVKNVPTPPQNYKADKLFELGGSWSKNVFIDIFFKFKTNIN